MGFTRAQAGNNTNTLHPTIVFSLFVWCGGIVNALAQGKGDTDAALNTLLEQ